jgi:hypothetical protein
MPKFSVDYSSLQNEIYKKVYKLSEVKDKIEKVAFDLVRFKDQDKRADLWQVQSADDGEYIIALYSSDDQQKTALLWDVMFIKTSNELQISYKGDPIIRLAANKLGLASNDLSKVESYLPERLCENKKLVKTLLNELSVSAKNSVLNKYPELF